jgi:molecular chaperone DnaK
LDPRRSSKRQRDGPAQAARCAWQRIKEEAEKAKIALSSSQQYDLNLPFITGRRQRAEAHQKKLTRAKMEQLCDRPVRAHRRPVKSCLKDADVRPRKIDELVLVGGMTRMPRVVQTAQSLVNKPPHQALTRMKSLRRRGHPGRRAEGRSQRRALA